MVQITRPEELHDLTRQQVSIRVLAVGGRSVRRVSHHWIVEELCGQAGASLIRARNAVTAAKLAPALSRATAILAASASISEACSVTQRSAAKQSSVAAGNRCSGARR